MMRFALALTIMLAVIGLGPPASAGERLSSRVCAAIAFHPIPTGRADGEREAGYYKSRLGRIDVRALVRNGVPQYYYVALDGAALTLVRGPLPPLVVACAKAKRLSAPVRADRRCLGDRLVVLIADADDHHYLLLYARHDRVWRFCTAGHT